MNRNYLVQLANFNHWADSKVIEWLGDINDKQWEQVNTSSFSSIRETAVHIASAEKVWFENWLRVPGPVFLSMEFRGTKNELIEIWKRSSAGITAFVEGCAEDVYLQPVYFKYPRGGRTGNMAFWQTVAHVVNHSTYHRGQLVTLLRQAGFVNLSSIDMATYFQLNTM
jgi:uncharacterized damage-inducible protein DinB